MNAAAVTAAGIISDGPVTVVVVVQTDSARCQHKKSRGEVGFQVEVPDYSSHDCRIADDYDAGKECVYGGGECGVWCVVCGVWCVVVVVVERGGGDGYKERRNTRKAKLKSRNGSSRYL